MKSTTWLALAILYLGALNLVFGAQAAAHGAPLARAPLTWIIAGKLLWGAVFVVTAWGVWRLAGWGRKLALTGISLYQAHIWINHLLFDASDYARQVWPFQFGLSLLTLAMVWGFMFLPAIRRRYADDKE